MTQGICGRVIERLQSASMAEQLAAMPVEVEELNAKIERRCRWSIDRIIGKEYSDPVRGRIRSLFSICQRAGRSR